MEKPKRQRVAGWGRVLFSQSNIFQPKDIGDIPGILSSGKTLARGRGMSYGDAALNNDGNLVETISLSGSQEIHLDRKNGILWCSSGTSQSEILKKIGPDGWVLPAIPGSANITIGGSIAADGHGKNHYRSGSISRHLVDMQIMLATGEVVEVSREVMPDLFWATIGGLGLTGIILSARLKLKPIGSVYARYKMIGFKDVDGLIDLMETQKLKHEYMLGWVDGSFRPGRSWHGAVSVGNILTLDQVENPRILPRRRTVKLPFPNFLPWGGMLAGRIVNYAIGKKFCNGRQGVIDINRFFFPQDTVVNWNLALYSGFLDYQCCVPKDSGREFFGQVHQFLNKHRIFCFLVAIKRFSTPERNGPLTFVQDGYSLALDIPVQPDLMDLLNLLDELVVDFGGRINPVKDARISSSMMRKMYPRLDEWLEIKEKYDPKGIFCSDLSRRMELT